MARDWPARDIEAMITLIDDPRHRVTAEGTYKLSAEQAKAILDLRLQRLTALGRDEIKAELDKLAAEIADYLDIQRSRARIQTIVRTSWLPWSKFATPRRTQIVTRKGGGGGRPDPPRGWSSPSPTSATSSGCRCRAMGAAPRGKAAPACKRARRASSPAVRCLDPHRCCSSPPRPRVQGEGSAAAPGSTASARKVLINILPLEQGELVATVMPLPEDENTAELDVMLPRRAEPFGATSSRTLWTCGARALSP